MSSEADKVVFFESVEDHVEESSTCLFNDKNYVFITDNTSQSGSFQSGQIQFDLSSFNSQSQWVDLREAVVEFPVKVYSTLNSLTGTSVTLNRNFTTLKGSYANFIDGCQIIINGVALQSTNPYENISATFKQVSSWSQDNLKKYGKTLGLILDDISGDTNSNGGVNDAVYANVATSVTGLNVYDTTLANKALYDRLSLLSNINPSSASFQTSVISTANMKQAGRNHVSGSTATTASTSTAIYTANYMAVVRLKDICDLSQLPLLKNIKGFLYISFNSCSTTITGSSTLPGAVTNNIITGKTNPMLINLGGGSLSSVTAYNITTTALVDGSSNFQATNAGALLTSARLLAPYFIANPKTDQALSIPDKMFSVLEKIVVPITVSAGNTVSPMLTTSVVNPKRLVMLPMWQNTGGATLPNPEYSAFDSVPASSGVYAQLQNLQVYVGNRTMFQNPVQYDFEMWCSEISHTGENGGLVDASASGLLTQQLWEQNYRFYTVDIGRRMDSMDGSSQSVQASFTNPSATLGMKVICIIYYEKKYVINTSTCTIQQIQ
jgi:hypothetical protein